MNYTKISILKDLTNSDDIIMELISIDAMQNQNNITTYVAYEKECDPDELTEQDYIEFLKSNPKYYDMSKQRFFKKRRFLIENMDEFEELQEKGILDKLPLEMEYEYRAYCENLKQEQLEQFTGKNIIFSTNNLSGKIFNMICANGFLLEEAEFSEKISLKNINIENIDETIGNVTKYKEKRFELGINIDSSNSEQLGTIINATLETENIELNIDINIIDGKEISNIINVLTDSRNIRHIILRIDNDQINHIEELVQNIKSLNQAGLSSKTTLQINLDEEYIKSLNKEEAERIDNYLRELKNNDVCSEITCNDNTFKEMNIKYDGIGNYLKLYNKIQDVIGCVPSDASDIDKITYVSNWIMQNYTYDYDVYGEAIDVIENYSDKPLVGEIGQKWHEFTTGKDMLVMLQDKKGVCQNIAELTKLLLEKVGVNCEICSTNYHVFNVAYIKGVPYWIDNTWDVNAHDKDQNHELSESQYFLTSSEDFYKTHSEYYSELEKYECPETIDREVIKDSLLRTAGWEHIVDKSVKGDELYSKTRTGLLTRIGETFKTFLNRRTKEKDEKEEK